MKRAFLTLSFIGVIAGTASAAMFAPTPSAPEAPRLALAAAAEPGRAEASKQFQPVVLETNKAPVPMKRTPKPAAPQWAVATEAPSPKVETASVTGPGEAAAKSAILADGYKQVRSISRAADGRWTARVLRGTTEIGITVEPDGSIRAD